MAGVLGIYIHIPFCKSKCDYCDFYSLAGHEDLMDRYQKALITHIKAMAPHCKGRMVDSIYFGGGTPSYYGEKRLRDLLSVLHHQLTVSRQAEITVECNPDSVDWRSMARLRKAGVNRISLGMQTADPQQLRCIHRIHTHHQVEQAVMDIRKAKIDNLSLDLIYGLPGQTMSDWEDTLTAALALKPEHISCYGLKVEEGTPLFSRVTEGLTIPDGDEQADLYLRGIQLLQEAGYQQYEISNFSKPGRESRHNMKYWLGREYLGFGPGASSDFGGRRFSIVKDLKAYIQGIRTGGQVLEDVQEIASRERAGEHIMMRLRTTAGIDPKVYEHRYLLPFAPLEKYLMECKERGLAVKTYDGRWHLTPKGFLVSNSIISDLLLIQDKTG